MSKYAYNHVRADKTIAEQKARITELEGVIIQLNLELQHLKSKEVWHKGEPTRDGDYFVVYTNEIRRGEPTYGKESIFMGEWVAKPEDWKVLGWMEIPQIGEDK